MGTRRLYVPLSVNTHTDDRIADAGDDAELLWYRILQVVKANESDGRIGHAQAIRLHARGPKAVAALVAHGLLRPCDDEKRYTVAGWSDWNMTTEQLEQRRREDRERKRNPPGTPPPSPPIPNGKRPESERNPNGKRPESARNPSDSLLERSRVKRSRDTSQVDTSTVVAPAGSDPVSDIQQKPRPAWLRGVS